MIKSIICQNMKYTILFTKMLFISCLLMAIGITYSACTDDENELQAGYGYVQFKLYKSASYDGGDTKNTRAGIYELDSLREAQKMKIVLLNNADATEIIQTINLDATSVAEAEFGLRSEKLQLVAGEYTVVGYYLYKIDGQDMKMMMSCEPAQKTVIKVQEGGLTSQDLTVNVAKRGYITITLKKDIPATRAANMDTYMFEDIKYVTIRIQNKFLASSPVKSLSLIPVVYTEKVEKKDGAPAFKYAVAINDSLMALSGGTYEIVSYETLDRSKKRLEYKSKVTAETTFTVEDNKTTEVFVPIELSTISARVKDYLALKAIWEALDGKNWKYSGQSFTEGTNWNFDKELDMWGQQPGVGLDSQGRVISISIGGFGGKGDVPADLGDLTELRVLSLGTHSDQMGDNVFSKYSENMTDVQMQAIRNDYYEKFVKIDPYTTFSDPIRKGFELKGIKIHQNEISKKGGISLKDVSSGNMTNGIKSLPKEIGKLTKLQQLYIANGHFEKLPDEIVSLKACTDVEVYNCPKMVKFPDALAKMPNIELLNIACNLQMPASEIMRGVELLANGNSKDKIQIMYLGINNMTELPASFSNFIKLGKLDCSYNKITKIKALGKKVKLVQVSFDYNQIENIPDDFCGFEDIESFSFSNNKLTMVPDIFDAKSTFIMGSVNFSYNKITGFQNGDNFKGINASTVVLGNNQLSTFPKVLFAKNSPISALNLSGNGMTSFPDGSLAEGDKVFQLQSLDLTFNKLSALPKEFNAIRTPYLYGLDMSYNRFSKFPTGPLNVDHLAVFGLRNQRDEDGNRTISTWPNGITLCPSLRALYLAGNDFRKITETVSPSIYIFEIRDNPNIVLDVSNVCYLIRSNRYILVYDSTQDIRGCDYLDLD